MAVKIRLARHGRKRNAYYYIVAADSRAPRDGRYIERIGSYNPNTDPATIDLDFDKALDWMQKGAQPTDTARAILSYKGVLFKNHLALGVAKGAVTQEQADAKFDAWIADKEQQIQSKRNKLMTDAQRAKKKALEAEQDVNKARAEKIAQKQAELQAATAKAKAADETENAE